MITSRGGVEGAGRCAGCLLEYQCFVVSCFTTLPLGAGGGLRFFYCGTPYRSFQCFIFGTHFFIIMLNT